MGEDDTADLVSSWLNHEERIMLTPVSYPKFRSESSCFQIFFITKFITSSSIRVDFGLGGTPFSDAIFLWCPVGFWGSGSCRGARVIASNSLHQRPFQLNVVPSDDPAEPHQLWMPYGTLSWTLRLTDKGRPLLFSSFGRISYNTDPSETARTIAISQVESTVKDLTRLREPVRWC